MQSDESAELQGMVEAFVQVEVLQNSRGYDELLSRLVKENRLDLISASTLIKLRSVLQQFRNSGGSKDG